MKLVVAIIQPDQFKEVKQSLFDSDIRHMTATTAMGTAPKSEQQMFRGVKKEVDLLNRLRVEIAVSDDKLETAIEAITKGAKASGGSGKIFVTELLDAVTVWTGDRGTDAL